MKTYLCLLLAAILTALPMSGQSAETRTMTIAIPVQFGVAEIPDWLPADIQQQIQILLESQTDTLMGWSTFILVVAIVVVAGIVLYCLWRCSQMIPPPAPPIPDDPSLADLPHALVYNLNPAPECELQYCISIPQRGTSIEWVTICNVSEITGDFSLPPSDTMFFRLEAK